MSKRHILCSLVAIACLNSLPAFASNYIPCDGCSEAQMQNAALAQGVGWYVVGNVTANYVEAFRVYSGSHANVIGQHELKIPASAAVLYVDQGNMTSQDLSAFSSYVAFYNASPVGYHKQFNLTIVPPGYPVGVPNSTSERRVEVNSNVVGKLDHPTRPNVGSHVTPMAAPAPGGGTVSFPIPGINAYSVLNNGPSQNEFLGWLSGLTTFGVTSELTSGIQAASVFRITDFKSLPTVSFTVTFTDGSHIGAYVDTSEQPPQLKINPDTAVDSHGNNIPASAAAVTGNGRQNYDFYGEGSYTDSGNMRKQIGGFGIDLPSSQRFACVFSQWATPQIHCVPF